MEAASIGTGSPARVQRSKGLQEKQLARLMVAPSMILIAVVAAWPIIYAIWLSLHEYSVRVAGLSRWAGFGNYSNALGNPDWWAALGHTLIFTVASVALETADRPRHGAGHARGLQGPGPPAHHRARPVGAAHGRHGDHLADDVRVAVRLREHDPRHQDGLARLRAAGADHHHPRRRLEDGAVHGPADPRRVAGDTRRDLRGGQGRRRLDVAAVPEDHAAAADAGDPRRADLPDARRAADLRPAIRPDRRARTARRRCRRSRRRRSRRTGSTGSERRWRCSRSSW